MLSTGIKVYERDEGKFRGEKERGVNGDGRFMFFVLSHHFISMPFYGSCSFRFFHIVMWNGKFLNIST